MASTCTTSDCWLSSFDGDPLSTLRPFNNEIVAGKRIVMSIWQLNDFVWVLHRVVPSHYNVCWSASLQVSLLTISDQLEWPSSAMCIHPPASSQKSLRAGSVHSS